ncbi:MAG: glutaminyl-peptide cyclotransferase [Chitinophagaceae bacterium]|nr:MAG: glutaminyl-peptide cyclotransferase [Chitinophagaceae bacterium]
MKLFLSIAILASLSVACNDNAENGTDPVTTGGPANPDAPRTISYSIVNTFPHDTSSFTQGLILYKGEMYEGTGEYGRSHLLKVNLADGKISRKLPLDAKYFGEGITILNDTLYQLTWKENAVFAYTLKDLRKVKEFRIDTEGWGITTDGKELIVSDGSSNLYYYNPSTFQLLRTQSITEGGSLSYNLNELEFIDGFIYANQWQAPYILKIDPGSGTIVGKIDLGEVWRRVKAKDPLADVPNGIAYDSSSGRTYITGKRWPELYEIQLSK